MRRGSSRQLICLFTLHHDWLLSCCLLVPPPAPAKSMETEPPGDVGSISGPDLQEHSGISLGCCCCHPQNGTTDSDAQQHFSHSLNVESC